MTVTAPPSSDTSAATTSSQSLASPGVSSSSEASGAGVDIVLYDGVCALCNGVVRFLLARDHERRFRYAALQSDFSRAALGRYGEDPASLSNMFLLESFGQPEERCLRRSRAILATLRRLGGGWAFLARLLSVFPTWLLDAEYRAIARVRYWIFGRYDSCPLPRPEHRHLFIDSAVASHPEAHSFRPGGETHA